MSRVGTSFGSIGNIRAAWQGLDREQSVKTNWQGIPIFAERPAFLGNDFVEEVRGDSKAGEGATPPWRSLAKSTVDS